MLNLLKTGRRFVFPPIDQKKENKSDRDESLNWNANVFEDLLPGKVDDEALFDGCRFLL